MTSHAPNHRPRRASWAPRGSRPAALGDLHLSGHLGLRLAACEWMSAAAAWHRHVQGVGQLAASCASCAAGTLCNAGRGLAAITDRKTAILILAADLDLADDGAAGRRDALLETALALHGAIYGGIQGKLL
jgi:hypothetical protein